MMMLDIWELVMFPLRVSVTFVPFSVTASTVVKLGLGEGMGLGEED
jgi:hypothetical protein